MPRSPHRRRLPADFALFPLSGAFFKASRRRRRFGGLRTAFRRIGQSFPRTRLRRNPQNFKLPQSGNSPARHESSRNFVPLVSRSRFGHIRPFKHGLPRRAVEHFGKIAALPLFAARIKAAACPVFARRRNTVRSRFSAAKQSFERRGFESAGRALSRKRIACGAKHHRSALPDFGQRFDVSAQTLHRQSADRRARFLDKKQGAPDKAALLEFVKNLNFETNSDQSNRRNG